MNKELVRRELPERLPFNRGSTVRKKIFLFPESITRPPVMPPSVPIESTSEQVPLERTARPSGAGSAVILIGSGGMMGTHDTDFGNMTHQR